MIKTTKKKLKKEKQRKIENAEAGAHDRFGVLIMEEGVQTLEEPGQRQGKSSG